MKSLKSSFEKLFKSSKENHDTKHMEGKYQKIGPTIHRSVSQVSPNQNDLKYDLEDKCSKYFWVYDLENLETRWFLVSV